MPKLLDILRPSAAAMKPWEKTDRGRGMPARRTGEIDLLNNTSCPTAQGPGRERERA